METLQKFIEAENNSHQVVIWSKSYCPYCIRAIQLFQGLSGVSDLVVHQLDRRSDGSQIQSILHKMTKQSTVPNIFVNKQHLGGNSDAQAANKNGSLQKLLDQKA